MAIKKIGDREGHYSFGRLRSLSFGKSGKMSVQVEESITRIVEQGQELCEAPTYSGLKSYREVIREVVGMYISQKYTHCERTEWSAFGKKNIYEALRKMDKILSELSEDIRTGKVAHSRITERQDRLYEQLEKVFR